MSWFLINLVSAFLLPPLNLLLVASIGLMLWHSRPRLARTLITVSIALLWLLSTPYFADQLLHSLEAPFPTVNPATSHADAIVVLSGGSYFHAPEYNGDTVSEASLQRLRYAAKLYRETQLPLLISGGKPLGNDQSEAQQIKAVLENEFHTPVQWTEDASDNTYQSARISYQLLQRSHIRRIYLVTHAWHMARSVATFSAAGFEVIAAPTAYTTRYQNDLLAFIPNASALRDSKIWMHEIIGIAWYRLKF